MAIQLVTDIASCPLFAMQLVVSLAGLGLGTAMLFMGKDPAVYLPVVTSIVGYWLPAPKRPDTTPPPPPPPAISMADSAESVTRQGAMAQ